MGEMEGLGIDDPTTFNNLVPYKKGQTPGDRHTWREILDMWYWERREYRWELNGDHGFKNIPGFANFMDNDVYHADKVNSYEKDEVDESIIDCEFVVDVPVFGPQTSRYTITEA